MSKQSELQCWEIIQCNSKHKCPYQRNNEKHCWEMVKEDHASSFHICVDCLVYLAQQNDPIFSDKEFCSILNKRQENEFQHYECKLAYALRHSTAIMDKVYLDI